MSDNDTTVLTPEPEPGPTGRSRRRTALVVGGTVAALLIGGGAFAAWQLLAAKGPAPEEALPASTLGVITLDLDPSASQKVAALKTIRKFPSLKEELKLGDDDDLREFAFDKVQEEGGCEGVDYEKTVKPWLGKRAALAAVDLGEETPAPALVVQVTDADEARKGVDALVEKCGDPGEDFGFTTTEDFLIISDNEANAKEIAEEGASKPLSEDKAYQRWSDELGDAGILNFYVGKEAARFLFDLGAGELGSLPEDTAKEMEKELDRFSGAAGTVRFSDGGLELAVAGGGEQAEDVVADAPVGKQVGDLPADSAVVLGFGVPKDFAETMLTQLEATLGDELDAQLAQLEAEFGLELPDDLQSLLGEGVTISLGGEAPASLSEIASPTDVPVGITVEGDPEKVQEVIGKVEQGLGAALTDLGIVSRDDSSTVAFATSDGYANELLEEGGLGKASGFTGVVPEAADSSSILFIDFNSSWFDLLTGEADDPELTRNIEPLDAFGLSAWRDGDVVRALVKLTTD